MGDIDIFWMTISICCITKYSYILTSLWSQKFKSLRGANQIILSLYPLLISPSLLCAWEPYQDWKRGQFYQWCVDLLKIGSLNLLSLAVYKSEYTNLPLRFLLLELQHISLMPTFVVSSQLIVPLTTPDLNPELTLEVLHQQVKRSAGHVEFEVW